MMAAISPLALLLQLIHPSLQHQERERVHLRKQKPQNNVLLSLTGVVRDVMSILLAKKSIFMNRRYTLVMF